MLVGHEAKAQQEVNPSNTVFDAKRFIGARYEDSQVQEESKRYPFKFSDLNGSVGITVYDGQEKRERTFAPQEISSFVVAKVLLPPPASPFVSTTSLTVTLLLDFHS